MSDEEWGPWIEHHNSGWPEGVHPVECVQAEMELDGEVITLPACDFDWSHADAVARYRRRRFRAEQTLREIAENIREPEAV